jgi:site-specific recombinase XerD
LPFDGIVKDAIAAYVYKGRPKSSSNYLFLRSIAPYQPFKNGGAVSLMLRSRIKQSGLVHFKGDGKSFHGLRRFIATEMVKEGITLSVIAEVLGDKKVDSTKQYIKLDIENLRLCALDIESIG